jgi:DNA-binding MarR family transcriptional regulator
VNIKHGPRIDDKLTKEEEDALTAVLLAIEQFMGTAGRITMPAQYLRVFLQVAQHEGKTVRELAQLANLPPTTMSRHLLDIGESSRRSGKSGFGLIKRVRDKKDERELSVYRTEKGRQLADNLASAIRLAEKPRARVPAVTRKEG